MPPGLVAFAHPAYGLLTAYEWVSGRLVDTGMSDYQLLGTALGTLHRLQGFPRVPSSFRHILAEATHARKSSSAAIRDAARQLADLGPAVMTSLFDSRSIAAHGDARPVNVVVGAAGLTLIDWDKTLSCSPEFELSIPMFEASLSDAPAEAISALATGYLQAKGNLELPLLHQAVNAVGNVYLVHTWFRIASGSNDAFVRQAFLDDHAIPRWRRWNSLKKESYQIWTTLLRRARTPRAYVEVIDRSGAEPSSALSGPFRKSYAIT